MIDEAHRGTPIIPVQASFAQMKCWEVETLLIGPVRPLGPRGRPGGIVERPVDRPLRLTRIGFEGDEHGDSLTMADSTRRSTVIPRTIVPRGRVAMRQKTRLCYSCSRLRSIQAAFSCKSSLWVRRSAVG